MLLHIKSAASLAAVLKKTGYSWFEALNFTKILLCPVHIRGKSIIILLTTVLAMAKQANAFLNDMTCAISYLLSGTLHSFCMIKLHTL
jgi:hypothetical protein